ncbi:MAG: SRPBCC family protein [Bacteroidota bacterium]
MSIHCLSRTQFLPIPIDQAWDFFSSPHNLRLITPPEMDFKITSVQMEGKTYAGQLIRYRVSPLPFYRTTWVTEITHVSAPTYFVDEQRIGPYCMWHHQHRFKAVDGGTEMTDVVHYVIPLGILGDLFNFLFIRKKIEAIFDYRTKKLKEIYS